ncbi:MAG: PAS domain S-box protein, partial [Gammaproteobacteria bacterium]|nr:PAS domain S-box protein [Gammaproteobacteria bacterium]
MPKTNNKKPQQQQTGDSGKTEPTDSKQSEFPIVGIGASAGGLNAFKTFFSHMPDNSNMAFVLVPHLDPNHQSLMVELLTKHTAMPICEAENHMPVKANHVYIIPPAKYLEIHRRELQLIDLPEIRGTETAIDNFLRSLAEDQEERAIGIILSGTGSHGTLGLQAIKANGGMAMVQSPDTAEYDRMPQNAIDTGCIDYILPPEEMPVELIKYAQHAYVRGDWDPIQLPATEQDQLNLILALLRARIKYDFRCYRKNMLLRRVLRRMGLNHIDEFEQYLELLRNDTNEVDRLYHDLLISVTRFFRDPEAYQVLEQRVIPQLIEQHSNTPVRVWIPGCATGEEAYSIAMLLIEQFSAANKQPDIQIYATDIDETALEFARQGIYPESITADISSERLLRFFTLVDSHYQVKKQLRESVVFAAQNLISDAPFSKLDLISCRNLLIYLEPDVQKKVISLFHFSLHEDGFLFLGSSETIGRQVDMYEVVSKKWRLFRRIGPTRRDMINFPVVSGYRRRGLLQPLIKADVDAHELNFAELTQRQLLSDYGPASALVNRKYEILYFYGATGDFLQAPTGEPTRDLIAMARQELRTKLRAACHRALRDHQTVIDTSARLKRNDELIPCKITVKPITDSKQAEGLLLVSFQASENTLSEGSKTIEHKGEDDSSLITQLEYELKSTREDLQSTIEQMESSNEELKASNEEIMSMNEELQSSNEELETSKEELQSLNEELSTVNNQLQDKVEQLDQAHNDMFNLLSSSNIATLFLDSELHIQQFTPATGKLLKLIDYDIGRVVNTFATDFTGTDLLDDVHRVLEKLTPIETEIHTADGHDYLRRCQPYRTSDNRIEGVVITFVNITERVRSETQTRRLATVVRDSNDAITVQDFDGKILSWNHGAEQIYGYTEKEALQMNIRALIPADSQDKGLEYLRQVAQGKAVDSYDAHRLTKNGKLLDIWMTVTPLQDESGQPAAIAITERDISERKYIDEVKAQSERLLRMVEHLPAGAIYIANHNLTMNRAAEELTGYNRDELKTLNQWFDKLYGKRAKKIRNLYEKDRNAGFPKRTTPVSITSKQGYQRLIEFAAYRFDDHEVWLMHDVTERMHYEKTLKMSKERLRAIMDNAAEAIIVIDEGGLMTDYNLAAENMFGYSADETIGHNISMLMPSPYREHHDTYLANYLQTGIPHVRNIPRELPGKRKDGSTFPMMLSVSKIDHIGLFCGIMRDLGEQKLLEKEIASISTLEQERIGRDIHDGLGQQLTGLSLMTASLQRELAREHIPQNKKLDDIIQHLQQTIINARTLSRGLAPMSIETLGIDDAIRVLIND